MAGPIPSHLVTTRQRTTSAGHGAPEQSQHKVGLWMLVGLTYYSVSGGPLGTEEAVKVGPGRTSDRVNASSPPPSMPLPSPGPPLPSPPPPLPRQALQSLPPWSLPTTAAAAAADTTTTVNTAVAHPPPLYHYFKAGGAGLALLGFLVMPLVWSLPEALMTAELSVAYPEG